jgi:hypothetical protein
VGKQARIRELRRLMLEAGAVGNDYVLLTPAQVKLARELGFEDAPPPPELEVPLVAPRRFTLAEARDVFGATEEFDQEILGEWVPREDGPFDRRRRVMRSGAPTRRSTNVDP